MTDIDKQRERLVFARKYADEMLLSCDASIDAIEELDAAKGEALRREVNDSYVMLCKWLRIVDSLMSGEPGTSTPDPDPEPEQAPIPGKLAAVN